MLEQQGHRPGASGIPDKVADAEQPRRPSVVQLLPNRDGGGDGPGPCHRTTMIDLRSLQRIVRNSLRECRDEKVLYLVGAEPVVRRLGQLQRQRERNYHATLRPRSLSRTSSGSRVAIR